MFIAAKLFLEHVYAKDFTFFLLPANLDASILGILSTNQIKGYSIVLLKRVFLYTFASLRTTWITFWLFCFIFCAEMRKLSLIRNHKNGIYLICELPPSLPSCVMCFVWRDIFFFSDIYGIDHTFLPSAHAKLKVQGKKRIRRGQFQIYGIDANRLAL